MLRFAIFIIFVLTYLFYSRRQLLQERPINTLKTGEIHFYLSKGRVVLTKASEIIAQDFDGNALDVLNAYEYE